MVAPSEPSCRFFMFFTLGRFIGCFRDVSGVASASSAASDPSRTSLSTALVFGQQSFLFAPCINRIPFCVAIGEKREIEVA